MMSESSKFSSLVRRSGFPCWKYGAHFALITARGTRSQMDPLTCGRVLLCWTVTS
jgi:hypothetical protein